MMQVWVGIALINFLNIQYVWCDIQNHDQSKSKDCGAWCDQILSRYMPKQYVDPTKHGHAWN